jgi:hypothetical protein
MLEGDMNNSTDPADDQVPGVGEAVPGEDVVVAMTEPVAADDDLDVPGDEPSAPDQDALAGLEARLGALVGELAGVLESQAGEVRATLRDVEERSGGSVDQVAKLAKVVEREVRRQLDGLSATVIGEIQRLEAKVDGLGDSLSAPRPASSRTARPKKKKAAAKKAAAKKASARDDASQRPSTTKSPARKAAAKKASGRKNIWVTREEAEGAWAVRRENSSRRLGTYRTQAEARTAGRERAERDKVELIWQSRDGKIAGRSSYGHDDPTR